MVAVGDGVTVGDRVASSDLAGAYAELAVVGPDRLVSIPPGVPDELAAAGKVLLVP